jgi:hypothetical protein
MPSLSTLRRFLLVALLLGGAQASSFAQQAPEASGARILLLPHRVVAGERATLAVLDVNGRLTPGVTINFSNGDRLTTDPTGRSLFVAPLNPGIVFASIANRSGRVPMVVLAPDEVPNGPIEIISAPRVASIADRFEIQGKGFCGGADENHVSVQGKQVLVLAASPTSLTLLPPAESEPGPATVEISCNKREAKLFSMTLVELALEADSASLLPGEHRSLLVRVRGTQAKLALEARNLATDVAELTGGNPARVSSTGGAENTAKFELVGRSKGSFLISIRLVATSARPNPSLR